MTLAEKQQNLIEDLNGIHDPHERLTVVMARADSSGRFDPMRRIDAKLVPGCVSRVWLTGFCRDGLCQFDCDADSPMVKGLVTLLCDLYSGFPPEEVLAVEPEFWTACGLDRLLSPTRLNGLAAVRKRIRDVARAAIDPSSCDATTGSCGASR